VSPPATGPQTFTLWLAEPVLPVVFVVNVAVLLTVVHVSVGTLNVFEYANVFGLGSVLQTEPRLPPNVSVTDTQVSTRVGLAAPKSKPAVPEADPVGVCAALLSQLAVAVFVPLSGLGANAYVHE